MPETQAQAAEIAGVVEKAAATLAKSDPSSRPLCIVDDGYMRRALLNQEKLASKVGVRMVSGRALWETASLGVPAATALVAGINENVAIHSQAARTRLLAEIYTIIKKGNFRNPISLAAMFRDMLDKLDAGDPESIDRKAIEKQHLKEQVEIDMLFALWDRLCADKRKHRIETLSHLAKSQNGPVFHLHWDKPEAWILSFLNEASKTSHGAMRLEALLDEKAQALEGLWQGKGIDKRILQTMPTPRLYKAETIEEAARAALAIVGSWNDILEKEEGTIGLVGYNRLLVRRVHSLFLQEGLHITDRSGWLVRNLLIGRVLIAMASGTGSGNDLASSLLQVLAQGDDGNWIMRSRKLGLGKTGIDEKLKGLLAKADELADSHRMQASDWYDNLAEAMETRPLSHYFEGGPAEENLRGLLHLLADEFSRMEGGKPLSGIEIRGLLLDAIGETSLVSDTAISDIQLVDPGRFSGQRFDALLLLGANDENLPPDTTPGIFGNDVLQALGLETQEETVERSRHATALLLAHHDRLGAVWSGSADASPYLELMGARWYGGMKKPWEIGLDDSKVSYGHSAVMNGLPQSFSPSDCTTLLSCPYRFHCNKGLGLRPDKMDDIWRADLYGSFVHEILAHFHEALAKDRNIDHIKKLRQLIDLAIEGSLPDDKADGKKSRVNATPKVQRQVYAWVFSHAIDDYLKKINALMFDDAFVGIEHVEKEIETTIMVGGSEMPIKGICDRIDRHKMEGRECLSVVDIKTGNNKYKKKNSGPQHMENPQIPMYISMLGKNSLPDKSAYWFIEQKSGKTNINVARIDDALDEFIGNILSDIASILKQACVEGVPMPANGADSTCNYCDFKGLCRKEHWQQSSRQTTAP